jgi:hypothetical protein
MYDALKIEFKPEHRLGICRPECLVDGPFMVQLLNFLLALEEVAEPFDRVLDLRLATDIPLTSKELQEFAEARREATKHLAPFRTAVIAPRPEAEAFARLYATLVNGSKIEVAVFHEVSPAAHWLHVPEEILLTPALSPSSPGALNNPNPKTTGHVRS